MIDKDMSVLRPVGAPEGSEEPVIVSEVHRALGTPMLPPFPFHLEMIVFGLGCFWGAERVFWQLDGVYSTQVGYAGGYTRNPTYEEVCQGRTGHAEVVRVVFDPRAVTLDELLTVFWESHDPTQGMRQGNDRGSQYRSMILGTSEEQVELARSSRQRFQRSLDEAGYGAITTGIAPLERFYYAEDYHQQYLHRNPGGYCGLGGTGVCMSRGEPAA